MAGEGIRTSKEAAQDMDDLEVKICKVKQLPGLAAVEVLGLMEVHQILVVSEDLNGKGRSVKVVPSGLQGMDDGKELLVIDIIVLFCRDEQLGEVGAEMPITIGISLEEDGI